MESATGLDISIMVHAGADAHALHAFGNCPYSKRKC